jgi:mRNA-degrading endonuclease toxin of MazEF toxin-antitoxin module
MSRGMFPGDIYLVYFTPSIGHEFRGERPAIVIQSSGQLAKTNLVTVMPLTSKVDKSNIDDILVRKDAMNKLFFDSLIKVHNIESFDRSRFSMKIGSANLEVVGQVKKYLIKHFDL